uniref:Uncharacterized protein n=1 Tax=Magallana gigas TaxID=29159 RepID=A0A8W8K5J5_MAGGI
MAKSLPPVSADKSAMDTFYVPGKVRVPHYGKQVSVHPEVNVDEDSDQEDSEQIQVFSEKDS